MSFMLSIAIKQIMLIVTILSVVMLSVTASFKIEVFLLLAFDRDKVTEWNSTL
jgi:hypothetical protein